MSSLRSTSPEQILHEELCWYAASGDDAKVKALLATDDSRVDPSCNDDAPLRWAVRNGRASTVKLLLADKRVNPSAMNNCALLWAVERGNIVIVKMLLKHKRFDPTCVGEVFVIAAKKNRVEMVKLLLADDRLDPSGEDNYVLLWALRNGHHDIARTLLKDKRVDPLVGTADAMRIVLGKGGLGVVKSSEYVAYVEADAVVPPPVAKKAKSKAKVVPSAKKPQASPTLVTRCINCDSPICSVPPQPHHKQCQDCRTCSTCGDLDCDDYDCDWCDDCQNGLDECVCRDKPWRQ